MGKFLEEACKERMNRSILVVLKDQMKPDEYADLLEALADLSISASAIHRTLAKHGYMASVSALSAFRRANR